MEVAGSKSCWNDSCTVRTYAIIRWSRRARLVEYPGTYTRIITRIPTSCYSQGCLLDFYIYLSTAISLACRVSAFDFRPMPPNSLCRGGWCFGTLFFTSKLTQLFLPWPCLIIRVVHHTLAKMSVTNSDARGQWILSCCERRWPSRLQDKKQLDDLELVEQE